MLNPRTTRIYNYMQIAKLKFRDDISLLLYRLQSVVIFFLYSSAQELIFFWSFLGFLYEIVRAFRLSLSQR